METSVSEWEIYLRAIRDNKFVSEQVYKNMVDIQVKKTN